jgi:hypothetical protein
VFDEDSPKEAKVQKPAAFLSFMNVCGGKKNIYKHKNFRMKMTLYSLESNCKPGD